MAAEPLRVTEVPEMEEASPVRHATETVGCGLTGLSGLTVLVGLEQSVIDKRTIKNKMADFFISSQKKSNFHKRVINYNQ